MNFTRVGTSPSDPWRERDIRVNGIRLHCAEAGAGPLVVLLHGFPDHHRTWRRQIPALAAAGRRVLAPDMRGYGLSDKPPAVADYKINRLVEDLAGLIESEGAGKAAVVGHDWGGAVAWWGALARPDLVERLVILNSPHPLLFARELRRPRQLLKSWYMFFFQLPRLPEWLISAGNFARFRRSLRGGFSQEALPDAEIALAVEALARPGALTAALNYYRAALGERNAPLPGRGLVEVPTLVIWGERDPYLGRNLLDGLEGWVPDLRLELIPEAGHWPHWEKAEAVNALLAGFLRPGQPPGKGVSVSNDGG